MRNIKLFFSLRAAPLGRKLWLAGGGMGLFVLVLVIGNQFIARDKAVTREMLGHDFLAFYTAGTFVREGRIHDLYQLEAVKDFEQATSRAMGLEVGKSFGPWWNPPFYALVFEPLSTFSYSKALDTWRWISVAAVAGAIGLLTSFVARSSNGHATFTTQSSTLNIRSQKRTTAGWQHWGLVPLLVVVSMPFIQSFSHGQNTFTSLLLLTATVALWRSEKAMLAGLVGGLLFYKPQLAAVVAAVIVFDLGWKALAGYAVTGTSLLAITLVAMPGALRDYIQLLPANVHWMQIENTYLWERHVTLKAFWRLLFQGREAGEPWVLTTVLTYLSLAALGSSLLWAGLKNREKRNHDGLIAATIATMPLLMPFYFDYDLLLLSVPATLYAVDRIRNGETRGDAWLVRSWIALYFWMFFNPAVAFHSHVNITVLLVTGVAGQLIWRAGQKSITAGAVSGEEPTAYAMAA